MNDTDEKKRKAPPTVQSRGPEAELEEKLRRHPGDRDTKVDVGSDESMDASDPPSAVQPDHSEPVPSSGFEDQDES